MFEKEAEKRTEEKYACNEKPIMSLEAIGYKKGFKDGAEFGYNKANEWHDIKNGLSEKEKYVLIYTDLKNVYIARLVEDDYFITNKGGFVQTSSVIAWKEIVLPKES